MTAAVAIAPFLLVSVAGSESAVAAFTACSAVASSVPFLLVPAALASSVSAVASALAQLLSYPVEETHRVSFSSVGPISFDPGLELDRRSSTHPCRVLRRS